MMADALASRQKLEVAQAAELVRLRAENEGLRDQVELMQRALGLSMAVPPTFDASSKKSRRQVWHFICALAKRGTLTHEAAMIALYGHKEPDAWPQSRAIDVYVCGARQFLQRHGVTFNTVWGEGWSMTQSMRIRTQQIIDRLVKGEAA
jgi:two-component system cell cycle response regulator CtrA